MPRPRIHAHLTIEAIEKEIAKYRRMNNREKERALIDLCRANNVPISARRISSYAAQMSFPDFEVQQNERKHVD